MYVEGCIPGWAPIDSGEVTPDPCDKVQALTTDEDYIAYAMEIKYAAMNGNREIAWIQKADETFYMIPGEIGEDYVLVPVIEPTKNVNHSHFGGIKMFSVDDIQVLYDFTRKNFGDPMSFTVGLSNQDGVSYIITVDDPVKFMAFGNTYYSSEIKKDQLETKYLDFRIGMSDQETTEYRFLDFIGELNMGISILKANANFTAYERLEKSSTVNQVTRIPCD